ncbi:MAG: response regulator [Oleispira sp.]|nr:response regulator [Oleispira sp.]MBL4880717.1 response regulator [Oleispira sp.]
MLQKYLREITAVIIVLLTNFNSKFPFSQEQDYQSSLKEEKIKAGLITTTITALVYMVFFIVDTWALPSQLYTAGLVRCSFFLLSIYILHLIVKKEDLFVNFYQVIIASYFLIAGLGIIFLLMIANQSEIATDFYFSGIMLVIFTAHGTTYLQPNIALIVSSSLTVITIIALLIARSLDQINTFYQISINAFMLISSVIAGVLCMDIRNRFSRKNFVLQANSERLNTEKSQFFAAASHDIRQPLQAISFLVSALRSGNTKPKDDNLFERLENSIESMSDLLNSLLDVSKLDAHVIIPKPQHLSLMPLLERLQGEVTPFAKAKNINIVIECGNDTVFADAILLEQVLNNLLSNAIRYTNSGTITLSAQSGSKHINISVKDTGMGIDRNDQEAIFNEFHQIHNPERDQNKGLGLGLSIVKRLCALQDWPLSLDSELGVGSCFSFKVAKGSSDLIQSPDKTDMNNNLGAIDVILIDDNESIRFSLSNILSKWGCKIRSFESTDDACEAIEQLPSWKPNLLISDYRLRNNVTGIEAIDKVKESLNYPITAMVITGDTAPEEIAKIEKSGLAILHKPIKPAQLRLMISNKMRSFIESK